MAYGALRVFYVGHEGNLTIAQNAADNFHIIPRDDLISMDMHFESTRFDIAALWVPLCVKPSAESLTLFGLSEDYDVVLTELKHTFGHRNVYVVFEGYDLRRNPGVSLSPALRKSQMILLEEVIERTDRYLPRAISNEERSRRYAMAMRIAIASLVRSNDRLTLDKYFRAKTTRADDSFNTVDNSRRGPASSCWVGLVDGIVLSIVIGSVVLALICLDTTGMTGRGSERMNAKITKEEIIDMINYTIGEFASAKAKFEASWISKLHASLLKFFRETLPPATPKKFSEELSEARILLQISLEQETFHMVAFIASFEKFDFETPQTLMQKIAIWLSAVFEGKPEASPKPTSFELASIALSSTDLFSAAIAQHHGLNFAKN